MFVNLLIGVLFQIVGYVLQQNNAKQELPSKSDLDEPTVESKPVCRAWGSVTIESPHLIGKWDKEMVKRNADTEKK